MTSNQERHSNYDNLHKDIFGESSPTFNTDLRNMAGSYDSQEELRMVDHYGNDNEEAQNPQRKDNVLLKKYHENDQQ